MKVEYNLAPKFLEEEVIYGSYANIECEEDKSRIIQPPKDEKQKQKNELELSNKEKFKNQATCVLTEINNNNNNNINQNNETQNHELSKIKRALKNNSRVMPSKAKLTENFILKNNKRLEKLKESMILSDDYKLNDLKIKQSEKKIVDLSQHHRKN